MLVDGAKDMMYDSIFDKLDLKTMGFDGTFQLADVGCSIGPNTFIAVQNIMEAVEAKYRADDHQEDHQNSSSTLEFQVLFNDHYGNDFNTLFQNLPPSRKYFAAGVPGSFHGRLFPKSTLHLAHASNALHWLSKIPKEITDTNSPAWNKGSIFCTGLVKEVDEVYSTQFKNDIESFLDARAQELVPGGLIVMGLVGEEKVDSFNLPLYFPTSKELKAIIERNGCFCIETMNKLPDPPVMELKLTPQSIISHFRAVFEGAIKEHFGSEYVDKIFNYLTTMFADDFNFDELIIDQNQDSLLVLLKRIIN